MVCKVSNFSGKKFGVHLMASKSDENKVKDNTFIVSTDKVIKSKFVEIIF